MIWTEQVTLMKTTQPINWWYQNIHVIRSFVFYQPGCNISDYSGYVHMYEWLYYTVQMIPQSPHSTLPCQFCGNNNSQNTKTSQHQLYFLTVVHMSKVSSVHEQWPKTNFHRWPLILQHMSMSSSTTDTNHIPLQKWSYVMELCKVIPINNSRGRLDDLLTNVSL